MIKMVALIKRKPELTPEQFRDYYEAHHAPMALRLLPMLARYERNFVRRDGSPEGDAFPEFDVVTQIWFKDQTAYDAFRARLAEPEVLAEVRADEAKFLISDWTRSFLVEERTSTIPDRD